MSKQYQFDVTLTLKAPILSQAPASVTLGLDTAMHRDENGYPALPGSLIRGNLRESWETLAAIDGSGIDEEFIKKWLGSISGDTAGDYAPGRSQLDFPHWWPAEGQTECEPGQIHRIRIDENTGAVATGALQVIESPWPSGELVSVTGIIRAPFCHSNEDAEEVKTWLERGFQMLGSIGALKGIGFGRVVGVQVESSIAEIMPIPASVWPTTGEDEGTKDNCVGLRLTLDRPFCIGKPAVGENNRFDSETYIPGAALIGAISERLKNNPGHWQKLETALDELHIRHALPVEAGATQRPLPVLQSMAVIPNGNDTQLIDLAQSSLTGLINDQVPAFPSDWKDKHWTMATDFCGQVDPTKHLDIRTAIEDGKAKDQQLFAMETVQSKGHEWLTNIDLSEVCETNRDAVIQELREVLSLGIWPLGKTKAKASVVVEKEYKLHQCNTPPKSGTVIISLMTPALLLTSQPGCLATNGGSELETAYKKAWDDLSGHTLTLTRYFTQERLYGGRYWWGRFGRGLSEQSWGEHYQPQILSEAGSVFVFEINTGQENKADKLIEEWQRLGLPQHEDHPDNWEHNPWIKNNGYGEIAVNLELHGTLQPKEQGQN